MRFWINIFNHPDKQTENLLTEQQELLLLIIKNQQKMSNQLDGIAADLQAANDKVDRISADVKNLDNQIAALSDAPTADEIAALKAQSAALVEKLTAVDDLTPDVTTEPPAGDGTGTGDGVGTQTGDSGTGDTQP